MDKARLYLERRNQEKTASRNFITAVLQMTAAISTGCWIYFIKNHAQSMENVWFFSLPCLIFGLMDIGIGLFAKYRVKEIRKKEMIYEVMED